MVKRSVIFVLLLAVAFTVSGCALTAQEIFNPPNIVLILTDDMRADDLDYMPKTRSLIVDQGLSFSDAFVTTSECCPSRASILRGQYAHNHDIQTNQLPNGGFKKFRDLGHEESTVATWLKEAGYKTALVGKYLNDYNDEDLAYVPQGWDEWYARSATTDLYYDYNLSENGTTVSYGSRPEDYLTDVEVEKAKDIISSAADSSEPLFMYLAPNAPHTPYDYAPRHEGLIMDAEVPRNPSFNEEDVSDKPAQTRDLAPLNARTEAALDQAYRKRLRSLLAVDDMVEGVVNELAATGRLENTYIFFTSDNGLLMGEHRIVGKKGVPYEESIKVPLVVRGPGIPAGRTTDRIALNTDLAPTFADLARATPPDFVDGRSLRPVFASDPPSWRTAFLEEFFMGKKSYQAIRTAEGKKYVEYSRIGEQEYYDLANDPYELESQHQTVDSALLETLQSRLSALKACAGETCRTAEDGP